MIVTPYRYALVFFRGDDTSVGQVAIEPDWEPAIEWARFQALRQGGRAGLQPAVIEPLWHDAGAPYVRGFAVRLEEAQEACEFPPRFFSDAAEAAAKTLIDSGKLAKGETYRYAAVAYPDDLQNVPATAPVEGSFEVEELPALPRLTEAALAAALIGAEPVAADAVDREEHGNEDPPVLLPGRVLDEAAVLARAAEGVETGGLLIGHLHRDPETADLFVEITAQVPARHTCADATKLTFTSATWTDVRAAIALRGKGELMLGWWHSHPVRAWCSKCPIERQRACSLARGFLSADDRALHRTVFPRAYSIALVANDVAFDDVTFSLFGWRHGRLERRGYHMRRSEPSASLWTSDDVTASHEQRAMCDARPPKALPPAATTVPQIEDRRR